MSGLLSCRHLAWLVVVDFKPDEPGITSLTRL